MDVNCGLLVYETKTLLESSHSKSSWLSGKDLSQQALAKFFGGSDPVTDCPKGI